LPHRTGKIIKNGLYAFERGENLLQIGILNFAFKSKANRQESHGKEFTPRLTKATFRMGFGT